MAWLVNTVRCSRSIRRAHRAVKVGRVRVKSQAKERKRHMENSIPCSIRLLPSEHLVSAAAKATEINPMNAPAVHALLQVDPTCHHITPPPRPPYDKILGNRGRQTNRWIHGQSSRRSEGAHRFPYERLE